jgi:hypothetical protein
MLRNRSRNTRQPSHLLIFYKRLKTLLPLGYESKGTFRLLLLLPLALPCRLLILVIAVLGLSGKAVLCLHHKLNNTCSICPSNCPIHLLLRAQMMLTVLRLDKFMEMKRLGERTLKRMYGVGEVLLYHLNPCSTP